MMKDEMMKDEIKYNPTVKSRQSYNLKKDVAKFLAEGGKITKCRPALGKRPAMDCLATPDGWSQKERGVRPYLHCTLRSLRIENLTRKFAAMDAVMKAACVITERAILSKTPEIKMLYTATILRILSMRT